LLDEFCVCFSNTPGFCSQIQHHIHTTPDFKPCQTRAYRVSELLKVKVERQVDELLRLGFIEPFDSPMTSGVVCVIKPDKSVRMCCEYRVLNSKTIPDAMPMQIVADCVHKVSGAKFISICDAKSKFCAGRNRTSRPLEIRFCDSSWSLALEAHAIWCPKCARYICPRALSRQLVQWKTLPGMSV